MRNLCIRIVIAILMTFGLASPVIATHGDHPCEPVAPYRVTGTASNYPTTSGFSGQPVVALPLALGGCYVGRIHGYVDVCATTCARLPVADYCQCYWGTSDQRVIDLSHAAWGLISSEPLSRGLIPVTVAYAGGGSVPPPAPTQTPFMLPDTSVAPQGP